MSSETASTSDRHPAIRGPHDVSLRRVEEADLPDLMRWLADAEVREFYGDPPATLQEAREEYVDEDPGWPCWRFVIEWQGRGVGEVQYYHQYRGDDYRWSAGVDIFVGEPDARGHGVGIEAIRVVLRHLFEELHVHRALIDPEVKNLRAIHVYQRAGFKLDGVLRHNAFEHGEYVDTQYLSLLEDEWPAVRAQWIAERGPID